MAEVKKDNSKPWLKAVLAGQLAELRIGYNQEETTVTEDDNSNALEIEIEIPEDANSERIQEIVKEAALRADMTHRSNGGNGLTIKLVEFLAETIVLQASGK